MMKVLRYLFLLFSTFIFILLLPFTQEKIFERVTAHYLDLKTEVHITKYTPFHYALDLILEQNSSLSLSIRHNLVSLSSITLKFDGDIQLFTHVAQQKLPHLQLNLDSYLLTQDNNRFIGSLALNTKKEHLKLSKISFDIKHLRLSTDYHLKVPNLQDTSYPLPKHLEEALETRGSINYKDSILNFSSDIIGGELRLQYDQNQTILALHQSEIVKILRFVPQELPLEDGLVDLQVEFLTPALLKGDISTMQGQTDANVSALNILGINVDNAISKLVATQDLSLYNHDSNHTKSTPASDDNRTHIQNMRLFVNLKNGKVHCIDCAIATSEHLIAINGDINLKEKAFESFEIGIVDERKCAYYVQPLKGTFEELDISFGKAGFDILSGSVLSLGSNIGDLTHSGGKLISSVGDFSAKTIDFGTAYIPIIKNHSHYLSDSIKAVGDKGESLSSKVSSEQCTPFYTGVITQ